MLSQFVPYLQDAEKSLLLDFIAGLGEMSKFSDFLTKVFKKRIKRKRKDKEGGMHERADFGAMIFFIFSYARR